MSRGKQAIKREREPDAVYKSKLISKVINQVMLDGKKDIATNIVYSVLEKLSEDKKEARSIFEQAVKNVMPEVEVRPRRIVGAIYQIPVPVKHDRGEALAVRWLVDSARDKSGKTMIERLFDEITLAYNKEGSAYQKMQTIAKTADANKAFAHYRW